MYPSGDYRGFSRQKKRDFDHCGKKAGYRHESEYLIGCAATEYKQEIAEGRLDASVGPAMMITHQELKNNKIKEMNAAYT
jgi:hypothetical protein